jgi:ataxia telangiectasia mutated family protein
VKDRNEALTEIEHQIDVHKFTNKELNSLCNGLFSFIDFEKASYLKNNSSATETRLQSGSYVLRKLISKKASRLKPQLVSATVDFITTRFFEPRGNVFIPLSLDLARTLRALLSHDGHKDHILSLSWYTLTDMLIKILDSQLRKNATEKYIGDLLDSLKLLLKDTCISFIRVSEKLSNMLCYYFNNLQQESLLTSNMLEISNQALILMSTTDIRCGLELIKSIAKIATLLVDTKFETTKDQLLIFGIFASEYINTDMCRSINEEGEAVSILDSSFRDSLVLWLDLSLQNSVKMSQENLDINMILFRNSYESPKTWINFQSISVKDESGMRPWLKLFSLAFLLKSLYHLERGEIVQTWKKRRFEENKSFSGLLEQSEFAISVILEMTVRTERPVQILGLKLLIFYLHNFTVDKNSISFEQILHYDNLQISPWISLVFKTLLEYGWVYSNDFLSQILKVNIQMLKEPQYVSIASQTIIQVLSTPNFQPNDRALNQLVASLCEYSEISGPSILNNDSLKFWVVFSDLGKVFKFADKSIGDKIVDWIISKWDSIDSGDSISVFPKFFGWLAGSIFDYQDQENIFDNVFTRYYSKWGITSELSRNVLRNTTKQPQIQQNMKWRSTSPALAISALDPLMDKFLESLRSYEGPGNGAALSQYISYGHQILQRIHDIKDLSSSADRLKYDIKHYLDIISPINSAERAEAISHLNKLQIINNHGLFIIDYVKVEVLLYSKSETPELEDLRSIPDDFADFGEVRKASDQPIVETSFIYSDLKYLDTIEQQSVKLLLNFNNQFCLTKYTNSAMDQVINYLEDLPAETFCRCFYYLLEYLEGTHSMNISNTHIRALLRQFGMKLLATYRFQKSPVSLILLSRFSMLCSKYLLSRGSEDLINDFSDVFNWFMSMASKGELCEEYSLSLFLKALFLLLPDSTALQIGDVPKTYNAITGLLRSGSNFVKVYVSNHVHSYLNTLIWNQKLKFLQDYIGYFDSPESASETSASLLLCLKNFSNYAYPFFMKSLSLILLKYHYPHFELYSIDVLSQILHSYNVQGLDELSQVQLLEIFSFWYREKGSFTKFPYQLLGFESHAAFYETKARLLFSIIRSKRTSNKNAVLSLCLNKENSELEYESIPLLIPLSFTENGLRADIYSNLVDTYSDSSLVDDHNLLVIFWFIRLADVSSEKEFMRYIPELNKSVHLSQLVTEDSAQLYCSLFLKLKLSDAIHEISRVSVNDPNIWSPSSVMFLLEGLFKALYKALNTDEELLLLRKLKLLMILGHSAFNSQDVLLFFVKSLLPYLSKRELHYDTSIMLKVALEIYPKPILDSKLYPNCLMSVFYELTDFKEKGGSITPRLEHFLLDLYAGIDRGNKWKVLFSVFHDILTSVLISMNLVTLDNIINYLHRPSYKDLEENVINVVTLVVRKNPDLGTIPTSFKTSKTVAEFFLSISKKDVRREIRVFASRYLAQYYMETGDDLKLQTEDFPRSFEYSMDANTEGFNFIVSELIKLKATSAELNNVIMINQVLGYMLYQYHLDPIEIDRVLDFGKHLAPFSNVLKQMDPFIFNLLNPKTLIVGSIEDVISRSEFEDRSTISWAQRITIRIFSELHNTIPFLFPLIKYLSVFPDLSVTIMNCSWLIYLRFGGRAASDQLLTFVHNCLNVGDPVSDLDEKRKLVLHLCHLVKCGAIDKIDPFPRVCRKLDFEIIYQTAADLGLYKMSLLFFEHYYSSDINKGRKLETFSDQITQIYEGLEDIDLLYGVPVHPSLDYAINIFNKTEENPWKRVMFNSASFDSSIVYDNLPSSKARLLQSLAANNLHGLSNLINNDLDPLDKSANIYDWYWKLNKWDISSAINPANQGEIVYKILRSVKEQEPYQRIHQLCEDSMNNLLVANNEDGDLLRTLAIVNSIDHTAGSSFIDLNHNSRDYIRSTDEWFKVVPFSTFENLILSRKVVFENIAYRIGKDESLIAACHELSRYGKYSRYHNEKQKSINSSVQLDNLVKMLNDEEKVKPLLLKLSNFESAATLWKQDETVISIAILNDNLKQGNNYHKKGDFLQAVQLPDSVIHSNLIKWNSESKQKKFEQIMKDHVEPAIQNIKDIPMDNKIKAEVYHEIGYFCYKQLKSSGFEENIETRYKKLAAMNSQFQELTAIVANPDVKDKEKRNAKTHAKRLQLQYRSDQELYDTLVSNKKACIEKSIEFFLLAISIDDRFDDENVDKFCALWLEFNEHDSVNDIVSQLISKVPVYKFIPWINQLASHLASNETRFQTSLQKVLLNMSINHPYHSLYHVMNLRVQSSYEISRTDKAVGSRADAANKIWNAISKVSREFKETVLDPIDELTQQVIELANDKTKVQDRRIHLDHLNIGEFWLKQIRNYKLPLPTVNNIPVSLSCEYGSLPRICGVDPIVVISSSGISLPKIMTVVLDDGSKHKLLLKGGSDDLRQDAIMEQVFEKVNKILIADKESRKRQLRIRTYKVVPLGPIAGMIEFVADSIALGDIVKPLHKADKIGFEEARSMMKNVQTKSTRERISTFNKIAKETPPSFRHFFYHTFLNVDDWYQSRQIYSKGLATTSIVGYVLGLGDRHLNNILVDRKTGEPIHIDLGVAFDQGKLLPVPETVPFRLTRDLVDGLGVTGVKGSFEKGSENVYRVLRSNSERIVGILNVLRHDPLYNWAISPVRKQRLQEIAESEKSSSVEADDAGRAVDGVADKLTGNGLSVEATVQLLIQEATDVQNLAVIYLGWVPFY